LATHASEGEGEETGAPGGWGEKKPKKKKGRKRKEGGTGSPPARNRKMCQGKGSSPRKRKRHRRKARGESTYVCNSLQTKKGRKLLHLNVSIGVDGTVLGEKREGERKDVHRGKVMPARASISGPQCLLGLGFEHSKGKKESTASQNTVFCDLGETPRFWFRSPCPRLSRGKKSRSS